jgi:hypothetical protein
LRRIGGKQIYSYAETLKCRYNASMTPPTWTLRTIPIADLTDYFKNPRSLSKDQFSQLKTSLDKFGMIDKPIVNLDMVVIGGHQRLHVLRAEGVKECECWIPSRMLTEREVEELNIRLNKNSGSWDFSILGNEFEFEDLIDWGFLEGELLGFETDKKQEGSDPPKGGKEKAVVCPQCGFEFVP